MCGLYTQHPPRLNFRGNSNELRVISDSFSDSPYSRFFTSETVLVNVHVSFLLIVGKCDFSKIWHQSNNSSLGRRYRKALHIRSHKSLEVHARNLRLTEDREPYCFGNLLQGDPVRRIQRMPSKHLRSSTRGRPPRDLLGF